MQEMKISKPSSRALNRWKFDLTLKRMESRMQSNVNDAIAFVCNYLARQASPDQAKDPLEMLSARTNQTIFLRSATPLRCVWRLLIRIISTSHGHLRTKRLANGLGGLLWPPQIPVDSHNEQI